MKVILVFVSSLDGKITKWGDSQIKAWSSRSDQEYFAALWKSSRLIVMGSTTYNSDPPKPSPNHHYIVMTRYPKIYKDKHMEGQLDFVDWTPREIISHFEKHGYNQMLLVGGPHVATSFFREQLIDEVWLTIEPRIFGEGGNFVVEEKLDITLRLINIDRVNDQGTLITRYMVLK